ncbi:MAG: hypothetical protein A4E19_03245 [Nitrospira sp. SG-bin1]|nr:MAG: hypothetical protein A4E19_03245 [Nitrospira sp. SG-bin1]
MLGALVMSDVVLALFFLHYWRMTRDRFFLFFTWSFVLGCASRLALAAHIGNDEFEPLVYLIRFFSYVIIVAAILDKNRVSIAKLLFQRT